MTELEHARPWRRRLLKALKIFVGLHVVGALLGIAILIFGQRVIMYHPMPGGDETPASLGMSYEDVRLQTQDGESLRAWFIPAEGARGTVLYCYGNSGNLSYRLRIIDMLHSLGVNLLIFDYRGYGDSTGSPTEEGTYRDVETAWRYLVEERGLAPGEIVVYGRSMGGPIASWLAARQEPAGLIVDSSFESIPRFVEDTYPGFLYWPSFIDYEYPTREYVARTGVPVLVAHSQGDTMIPVTHGRAMLAAARDGTWLDLEGGHGNAPFVTGDRYLAGVARFLDRVLRPVHGG